MTGDLAIITVRGGTKGLLGKNMHNPDGFPRDAVAVVCDVAALHPMTQDPMHEVWMDVGRPEDLAEANKNILDYST